MNYSSGYLPSPPDKRDYKADNTPDNFKYIWDILNSIKTPNKLELWQFWPRIENQFDLGSCVTQGVTTIIEYNDKEPDNEYFERSRRGLYYDCLIKNNGSIIGDVGTDPRTALLVAGSTGVGAESLCPYYVARFREKPSDEYYAHAAKNKIRAFFRLETTKQYRACLTCRWPFVVGVPLFSSFNRDSVRETGIVPMPSILERLSGPIGYHLITAGRFDDSYIGFANSYGIEWGDGGKLYLPYSYIETFVIKMKMEAWFVLR